MQRDLRNFNAPFTNLRQNLRGEVQPGRGSRHRPCLRPRRLGVYGLVALLIHIPVRCPAVAIMLPMNIGRKRHVTDAIEACHEIVDRSEADAPLSETAALDDLGFQRWRIAKVELFPIPIFRPGRTRHPQSFWSFEFGSSVTRRVNRTSTCPRRYSRAAGLCWPTAWARSPLRWPKSRAGNTRVLFTTSRSSGRNSAGNSRKLRSCQRPSCRVTCSRRDPARSGSGSCAMRSGGRS